MDYAFVMKLPVQFLYRLKRMLLRRLRWRTRGVKVMLFNDRQELLLVRNSYGRTHIYVLPGGGIRPFESPAEAAAREVREEVGVRAERLAARSTHVSEAEGKRDTIHLFTAFSAESPKPDGVEVVEARFFPLDALPAETSAATLRRIGEYRGVRPVEAGW
jgi:8-oxo-dGTP pyrophosphatase MutT (NUDIX family)